MVRQAYETVLHARGGKTVALVAKGILCREHQAGHAPFIEAMGFISMFATPGMTLRSTIRPDARLFRKASLLQPAHGVEVLAMGVSARRSPARQIRSLCTPPVPERTPRGSAYPACPSFEDLVRWSGMNLAVAWDGGDVVVGGASPEAVAVVRWLSDMLANGQVRFIAGERAIAFADPSIAGEVGLVGAHGTPRGCTSTRLPCEGREMRRAA